MKLKLAHFFLYVLLLLSLVGCGGGSDSSSGELSPETPEAVNRFSNGYRLVKETYELASFNIVNYYEYDYGDGAGNIVRKKYELNEETGAEEEVKYSDLYFDGAGRLTGGSFTYTSLSGSAGVTEYMLSYDAEGLLIEFRESEFTIYDYAYSDGLLNTISITDILGNTYTWSYTHDADSNIQTIVGGVGSKTWNYSYDNQTQLVSVAIVNQFGEQLTSHDMTYDENGNLLTHTLYGARGNLVSTRVFEYEATDSSVYNHGLMRVAIEPVDATGLYVVR